jgi:hypothetical protein
MLCIDFTDSTGVDSTNEILPEAMRAMVIIPKNIRFEQPILDVLVGTRAVVHCVFSLCRDRTTELRIREVPTLTSSSPVVLAGVSTFMLLIFIGDSGVVCALLSCVLFVE